jgi:hypothetical protein
MAAQETVDPDSRSREFIGKSLAIADLLRRRA